MKLDIMDISSPVLTGMPKAPYAISDSVYNSVVKLQEDTKLNKVLKEYKAVIKALELTDKITKEIFEEEYQKRRRK